MGKVKLVRASAGSGKTYRLSYEYVKKVLADPEAYRHILAVTFTNKATEEMKRRIIQEINDLANGQTPEGKLPAFESDLRKELSLSPDELRFRSKRVRTRILHDYSHFTILTIDKFFQRIIRSFIRELGVESDFTLELQTESVLGNAADRLIEETLTDAQLRDWIGHFLEEQISEGRGWDVKRELMALGKEVFSEEYRRHGTSEKTRAEIRKIISSAVERAEKLKDRLVRLAGDAVRILERHGLAREDFPYGKSGFINYFYTVASGEVWGGYGKRVSDALLSDDKWFTKTSSRKGDIQALIPSLKPLLMEICEQYDMNIRYVNTTFLLRENYRTYALLGDLSVYVREACDERNVMLISETNHIINQLIGNNDAPFIFEKAGNHFTHFMIDEFQDTSESQWSNFLPLLSNAVSQSDKDPVLLVGDVKQSIYRWRGGDWEILGGQVGQAFDEVEEITLDKNYRSFGNIVRFNNEMIASAVQTADLELNTAILEARETGAIGIGLHDKLQHILARAYTDCRQKVARDAFSEEGYVKLVQYDKEEEDRREQYIIETIEDLQRRGFRAADIAVLVRYNAEAVAVANLLLEHKSSSPDSPFCYDVVTQEALVIGNAPVIRFITACFRLSVNIEDSISCAVYLKYQDRSVAESLDEPGKVFFESIRRMSIEEAFEQVLLEYKLEDREGSVAYLQAFHDQLLSFGNNRISDIPLFLRWWDESGSSESVNLPNGQDAITIITIHKAKGLQYPAVLLPYATWDMTPSFRTLLWTKTEDYPFGELSKMPVKYRKTMADSGFAPDYYRELVYTQVDNLNMLYVALTRAEEELYLLMPRMKKNEGTRVNNLLLRSMREDGAGITVGDLQGKVTEKEGDLVYEWGDPVQREREQGVKSPALGTKGYPTYRFTGKIRLKRDSERYVGDDGEWRLSPRQYGRLMHRIFESVSSMDEIEAVLDRFETEGIISSSDKDHLSVLITNALDKDLVRGWFDGSWDEVRNENDIIVPSHVASLRRPDRVMIREGKVVVVDYKFGHQEKKVYIRQIQEYMGLIREMGYGDVEGYVWYVETGNVVQVS